jgi:DNA-binding NarL/FixJ family response regulator
MYVQCVLAEMEPLLRDVLLLNANGLSQAEIAHQLGYKESTVATYLSKAHKRFRQLYCEMDHT